MSGRHEQGPGRRPRARWLIGAAGLLATAMTLISVSPASASTNVKAQLTLTGVATGSSPVGGSVIGIHPGDSVSFSTSTVPTAGLAKLGLSGLLDGVLGNVLGYQSVVDFSHLPGGAKNTVLKSTPAKTFTFSKKGTYPFTFSIQQLQLLGGAATIALDGNQLRSAGVKLNATNQYVGSVVVADNPPKGGLSIQVPGVSVAPNLPIVGQLPTLGVPGVTLPTIGAPSIPNLLPGKSSSGKPGHASKPASNGPTGKYTPPGLTVPDMVVPNGDGNAVYAGDGGFYTGNQAGGSQGGAPALSAILGGSTAKSGATTAPTQDSTGKNRTIDLASQSAGSPTSQVPVVLAILAIIALALVAGTYARLFLLRKQS